MKILCTHPGRYGDLLWALPTVRALAVQAGEPVDLLLSPRYSSDGFIKLLAGQRYIGDAGVVRSWEIQETAPITPRAPALPERLTTRYDHVVHLAYEGWPTLTLPYETYRIAGAQVPLTWPLHLDQPWIANPHPTRSAPIAVGFSDEHFELKVGIDRLLRAHFDVGQVMTVSGGPRWREARSALHHTWDEAALFIANARVFVGCCSALHVLACALGTPVIVLEPNTMRHHDVFYPYGKLGPEVTLVLGLDGQPTFDSRHLIDAIVLQLQPAAEGVQ